MSKVTVQDVDQEPGALHTEALLWANPCMTTYCFVSNLLATIRQLESYSSLYLHIRLEFPKLIPRHYVHSNTTCVAFKLQLIISGTKYV